MTLATLPEPRVFPAREQHRIRCVIRSALVSWFCEPASAETEDRDDVAATLCGDGRGYERIIARYQSPVTTQMQRFSRNPSDVETLVQDVFVEAYSSLGSFRSRAPLLHWLRKIAVRVGYRFWKAREKESRSVVSLTEAIELTADPPPEPSEAADRVQQCLTQLRPRDRLVLTLLYWDGLTVAEASELTGWSRTMVKVQVHRARRRLRRRLEKVTADED